MTALLDRPPVRFVGPSIRDARLHTASVLLTVQLLGQVVLDFQLSIAQLLVSLGTAGLIELAVTFRRTRTVIWPASALLTGNGIALILRVPGTQHGDWWSLRGWWIFAGTAAVGIGSKYLIRVGGRPLFNPSNVALVLCFLLLGSGRVEPLDFWWGPADADVLMAIALIATGGFVILRRLGLLTIALVFWATFAAALGVVALAGHCMTARWHVGPLCDGEFWWVLVTSPEVLIFSAFMITDPKTVPEVSRARIAYAIGIAVLAALLIAPQRTEFGAKVALLGALTIVCVARPALDRWFRRDSGQSPVRGARRRVDIGLAVLLVIGALVGAGSPARGDEAPAIATSVEFPKVAAHRVPSASVADDRLSRQVPSSDAAAIAIDLAEDLALQEQALCGRDLPLAAASADRAWLDGLEAAMQRGAREHAIDVPVHDLDTLVVSIALRVGQEEPAVLATVTGTVRVDRYGDDCDVLLEAGTREPFAATFEVLWNGQRHLVVSDALPEGFTPPSAP